MTNSEKHEPALNQVVGRRIMMRNILAAGAIIANAACTHDDGSTCTHDDGSNGSNGDYGHNGKCFLKGAKIRTADGDRKVEELAAGDMLPTLFGGVRPIRWVGRYSYGKSDPSKPWANDARPVRIARSALAPNVPSADLFVSSGHALFVDDVLVPARDLINGITITRYAAEEFDKLEYYHIKLDGHDVIYAEGAACETLLAVREHASNFAEYAFAYSESETLDSPCAPLVSYHGRRGRLRSRFRSAIAPWYDRREMLDIIRDRLEERAFALCKGRKRAA
ncbi:MAG: Hint domain-containing protein [Methylocystis sp.]|uniref:Hint domain-containing protein n=1 Tax=Methylocystis sp. TaxID=1911079 RepID=UPI003947F26D